MSLAEVIEGVSDEIERLCGEVGLLIIKSVMDGEVESLADPKGAHDPDRRALDARSHWPGDRYPRMTSCSRLVTEVLPSSACFDGFTDAV